MPLLLSLGQHPAPEAVHRQLRPGELLLAFLDDIYIVCSPARVGMVHTLLENALWVHARIQVHAGKAISWREEPNWWWSMPECGEEATKQVLQNRGSRSWVAARSGTPSDVVGPDSSDSRRAVVMGSLAPLRSSPGKLFHSGGASRVVGWICDFP